MLHLYCNYRLEERLDEDFRKKVEAERLACERRTAAKAAKRRKRKERKTKKGSAGKASEDEDDSDSGADGATAPPKAAGPPTAAALPAVREGPTEPGAEKRRRTGAADESGDSSC